MRIMHRKLEDRKTKRLEARGHRRHRAGWQEDKGQGDKEIRG